MARIHSPDLSSIWLCLTTDFDIAALREGMNSALRFIEANTWQGYVLGPLNNITSETSDADLEVSVRAKGTPNYHIIGTANMSPKGTNYGVNFLCFALRSSKAY
jgi:choline dehydrogenase